MSYMSALSTSIRNPQLRLLNGLRAGSKPIMTLMGLPSFRAAQVIAQTGLDVGDFLFTRHCYADSREGYHY